MDHSGEKSGALDRLAVWRVVRPGEGLFTLYMCVQFFLIISTFWILKPLKKSVFLQFYDASGVDFFPIHRTAAQAEQLAKIGNMLTAYLAVIAFSWLAGRVRRQRLIYVFSAFFAAGFLIFFLTVHGPDDLTVWSFYWFGDLFSIVMITAFFAVLADSVTPEAAKRLYGLIVLGGVLGGVFGSTFVSVSIGRLSPQSWLSLCAATSLAIALFAGLAGREYRRHRFSAADAPQKKMTKKWGNSIWEGARLTFRSRYLLSIVALVALYELSSSLMDFMFTATVSHSLDGPAIGAHVSKVYAITNWFSMGVQLLLTGFVMSRLGVGVALLVMPLAVIGSSAAFVVWPSLWVGSMLNTADGGFSYSINQSAREALYVKTTPQEKYEAKAFIDMFVQRTAKALAVVIALVVTTVFTDFYTVRWLGLIIMGLGAIWLLAARYAGRQYA